MTSIGGLSIWNNVRLCFQEAVIRQLHPSGGGGGGGGRNTDLVPTPPRVNRDSKKLRLRPPGFEGTGLSRGRQALGGLWEETA